MGIKLEILIKQTCGIEFSFRNKSETLVDMIVMKKYPC
jgi:hypothetical protein